MNKTTYANFYVVVNVFLGVDCVFKLVLDGNVHTVIKETKPLALLPATGLSSSSAIVMHQTCKKGTYCPRATLPPSASELMI